MRLFKASLAFFMFLLLFFYGMFFYRTRLGEDLERKGLDILFLLRGPLNKTPPIVIVSIDDSSFDQLKLQWPWPRSLHALLVDILTEEGASVIGFDVLFFDPSNPADDGAFKEAIRRSGRVVLAGDVEKVKEKGFGRITIHKPLKMFRKVARAWGLTSVFPDSDNVIREGYVTWNGYHSFDYVVAKLYAESKGRRLKEPPGDFFFINYVGPPRSIPTVSYYQALNPDKFLPKGLFKGKIVLVGRAPGGALALFGEGVDTFFSPYSRFSTERMPGVEIHANAVKTIIDGDYIKRVRNERLWFVWLFFGALSAALVFARPIFVILIALLLGAASTYTSLHFFYSNLWLPLSSLLGSSLLMLIGSISSGYAITFSERRFIKKAFSMYLPPSVVREILKDPSQIALKGELKEATVLFTDLAGFTSISEKMNPEELVSVLNRYFDRATRIVVDEGGIVDKYIGDAVMAVWGVPLPQEDHALRAVRAGIKMVKAIEELSEELVKEGYPPLRIRVGIASGLVVAGNIGSTLQYNYTVIGDTVNLASRLESMNKETKTSILFSESTASGLDGSIPIEEVGFVKVRGKEKPVKVYTVPGV